MRVLVLALVLLVAPLSGAHGDEPDATFDPLRFDLALYLGPGGSASEAAPPPGSAPFASASPASPAAPLSFAYVSPVKHELGQGIDVTLRLRADAPVLAQGDALELALALEGSPVKDSAKRVPFSKPALAPGDEETIHATLQAPGAVFAKGARVALTVAPLVPVLAEGALSVVLGESGSRMRLESMRVPTVADLELQDASLTQFDARTESFKPSDPGAVVVLLVVRHDRVDASPVAAPEGAPLYVVLRGDEPPADAEKAHAFADRAQRVNASHELRVGATLARVVPNVGVVVPLGATAAASVSCARNCPAGFSLTLRDATGGSAATGPTVYRDDRGTLVPPPADTSGIKESPDAPSAKKSVDALPWVAALVAATLAARLGRR